MAVQESIFRLWKIFLKRIVYRHFVVFINPISVYSYSVLYLFIFFLKNLFILILDPWIPELIIVSGYYSASKRWFRRLYQSSTGRYRQTNGQICPGHRTHIVGSQWVQTKTCSPSCPFSSAAVYFIIRISLLF